MILDLYCHLRENSHRFIDEVFRDEFYKLASPRLTVVDLGAFHGEYCFYCLPFLDKAYAVEPHPEHYQKMVSLIERFNLEDKIIPLNVAISDKNGVAYLKTGENPGDYQLVDERVPRSFEVKTMTLNSLIEQEGIKKIDILKIDIEGSENRIFNAPEFSEVAPIIDKIIGEPHDEGIKVYKSKLENCGFVINEFDHHTFLAEKHE